MAMIGPTSSCAPSIAASNGECPSFMCRSTFSTTTMASSTTRPTERTIASSVSRFSENPNSCIKKTAPTNETGIATTGTITVRSEPRKRKITTMTMKIVSISVWRTSWMALSMYLVASKAMVAERPVGSSLWTLTSSSRTRLMTSRALALGSTQTPMKTALFPDMRTSIS